MGWREILMCSAFAVALPIGQVMFKWAAVYNEGLNGPFVLRLLQNWPLMAAFAWYGATAILWFYILTRAPLSKAYVFSILGSALVPLLAFAIFKEPLTWRFGLGYAVMLGGFFILMQGRA